ncbi:MAG: hypothetical protein ACLTK8_03350 [Paeniclostridium sp.]
MLEADATAIVVKEYELRDTLASLGKKPKLVITDSQVLPKFQLILQRYFTYFFLNFICTL